jgi:hypothetical protein
MRVEKLMEMLLMLQERKVDSTLRYKSDLVQVGDSLPIFRSRIPHWEVDNVLIHLPVGTPTMTRRARNMIYQ